MGRRLVLVLSCERVELYAWRERRRMRLVLFFWPPFVELTVKSVVGGIVPSHGFDHECFNGFQDSSFIWGRIHFEMEGVGIGGYGASRCGLNAYRKR